MPSRVTGHRIRCDLTKGGSAMDDTVTNPIRVLLVDDHPLTLVGAHAALEAAPKNEALAMHDIVLSILKVLKSIDQRDSYIQNLLRLP